MRESELFDRWPDAERILDAVIDLEADERRTRALEACGPDDELRRLVCELLDAETCAGGLPAEPAGIIAAVETDDELPDRVGPFRIERELGRGGMGRVLLGRRERDPAAPALAIKLLDGVAPSAQASKRFARERATLARLHAPEHRAPL